MTTEEQFYIVPAETHNELVKRRTSSGDLLNLSARRLQSFPPMPQLMGSALTMPLKLYIWMIYLDPRQEVVNRRLKY